MVWRCAAERRCRRRWHRRQRRAAAGSAPPDGAIPGGRRRSPQAAGDTNQVATLTITFRAVSLKNVSGQADADKGIAYAVLQELQNSPLFDPDPQQTHTASDVTER